jgi:hypothetical protein
MGLKQLEQRAGMLASVLQSLVSQGEATRKMALEVLIANGEHASQRLNEAAEVSAPGPIFAGVTQLLEEWCRDVRAELLARAKQGGPDGPPKNRLGP